MFRARRKKYREKKETRDNRVALVKVIIFLLGFSLIAKLYFLQVAKYEFYSALAADQHAVLQKLEPERGGIFIQDSRSGSENSSLYPLASNKDFALVYSVPAEVENPRETAEQLYAIFDEEKIKEEVENLLAEEDKARLEKEMNFIKTLNLTEEEKKKKEEEVKTNLEARKNDAKVKEEKEAHRQAEINLRKETKIGEYEKVLSKPGDPYEPIARKVDEDVLNKVLDLKLAGIHYSQEKFRYYPEKNIGSHLVGFLSEAGEEKKGQYGLEGFFNSELAGVPGKLKGDQGAGGELLIIDNRAYTKPQEGSDLILTIDRTIQFTVCEKLKAAVEKNAADGGSVIVINPNSGAILAMCSYPDFDPNNYREVKDINIYNNPVIFSQYEPGSIFKAITMAMSLDQEKITPATTFNDTGVFNIADYSIKNSDKKAHGVVNMVTVLEESLNTGAIFVMQQIGPDKFSEYAKNFGFGEKAGVELEGESKGDISNLLTAKTKITKELYAATASFGQGLAVTPLQMVYAFGAIANGGQLMKPYIVKEIVRADGERIATNPQATRRVISEKAAVILGGMLVEVVENGHGKKAGVKGYYVAGKTGTAQIPRSDGRGYISGANIGSFAGFAPASDPKFAMLVRIDRPRNVAWAESSAAPLFGEIADFLLQYYQVPKERE